MKDALKEAVLEQLGIDSEDMETNIIHMTLGRDHNGNKTVRVVCKHGGFSMQTNGNLPITHARGVGKHSELEVAQYVSEFGTGRQINLVRNTQ